MLKNLAYFFILSIACWELSAQEEILLRSNELHDTSISLSPFIRYYEDPQGKLSLADVQTSPIAQQFKKYPTPAEVLSFGYTSSAYWLRLTLTNQTSSMMEQILEIGSYPISRVDFYRPDDSNQYTATVTGSRYEFSSRPYKNRFFVFPISIPPNTSQTYYFRVESSVSLVLQGRLWNVESYHKFERNDYLIQAIYFGLVIAMILYNLMLYFALRDFLYIQYVSFVASGAVTLASLNGLAHEFIWQSSPLWSDVSTYIGFSVTLAFLLTFLRRMLNTQRLLSKLDIYIRMLIGLLFLLPFCIYASIQTFSEASAILFGFTGAFILGISVYCAIKRERSAYYFVSAFSVLCLGMILTGLYATKIIPANFVTTNGMQIGSAFEMLLLAFALADRFNQIKKEKVQAQEKALKAEQELVETLKASERMLEEKVIERTNELSRTLSIIRKDLSTAEKIQKNIMLTDPSLYKDLIIASRYLPISEVGGDFFSINKLNEFTYRFFLADATGHGVQAAMITMAIKGIYDSLSHLDIDTSDLLGRFNNHFIERYRSLNTFLTCLVLDIDIQNFRLKFASAGHPTSLLIQNDQVKHLQRTGKMIGLLKNFEYKTIISDINPDDRIFIFTDGIFEEFNANKVEFGEERVTSILQQMSKFGVEHAIDSCLNELDTFLAGVERQDDITILGIQIPSKFNKQNNLNG